MPPNIITAAELARGIVAQAQAAGGCPGCGAEPGARDLGMFDFSVLFFLVGWGEEAVADECCRLEEQVCGVGEGAVGKIL